MGWYILIAFLKMFILIQYIREVHAFLQVVHDKPLARTVTQAGMII